MKKLIVTSLFFAGCLIFSTVGYLKTQNRQNNTNADLPEYNLGAFPPPDLSMCRVSPHFDFQTDKDQPYAPLLKGLGDWHYKVTTSSDMAQQFYDQGMRLNYAFNHGEAHRSFKEAARLDPQCAMAYWGQALVLGPNINDPFPSAERYHQAWKALEKAEKYSSQITVKELALIKALQKRYIAEGEPNIQELNQAYYQAMKKLARQYPDDPEIQVLYVASLMNTMPWDYWKENNQPKEGVQEGIETLKKVTAYHPEHPGGHHYYIHLMEAAYPEKAERSADLLKDMMPAAAHISHMPSHIYIRTGRYHDGTIANIKAIDADLDYIAQCRAQDFYKAVYFPHNYHFLWATASMEGNSKLAIEAAEKVPDRIPRTVLNKHDFLQEFLTIPLYAYIRFGKWDQILAVLQPEKELLHANMIWYYARGMAQANSGRIELAKQYLTKLDSMRMLPGIEQYYGNFNNSSLSIGTIARNMLAGEIAWKEKRHEDALQALSLAAEQEDRLAYIEPPPWDYPVRHNLGALLLAIDRPAEAEKVYKKDLKEHPENGWALYGLMQSYKAQKKNKEANETEKRFKKAWSGADVNLHASRF